MIDDKKDVTSAELRKFGLLIGGIFAAIAFWPALARAEEIRLWALVTSIILIVPAVAYPALLRPVHKAWMRIGAVLGWINTRILLGIVFYGLITPIGMVFRVMGKDTMRQVFAKDNQTYRVVRTTRPRGHMKYQF